MSAEASFRPVDEPDHGGSLTSVGELLGEISGDISTLMRQEVELAKTELRQSASNASKAGGMLGGAEGAAHMGLLSASVALGGAPTPRPRHPPGPAAVASPPSGGGAPGVDGANCLMGSGRAGSCDRRGSL